MEIVHRARQDDPALAARGASLGSLDRSAFAQLVDALAAQVKLLPGERALCFVDDTPAQRLFTVVAALAAGGEVFVAPSGLPAEPARLASTLQDQRIAWMLASGTARRSAIAGLGDRSLDMVALVDVTELGADLARQLLDKGCTLVSTYRPHALELPVAAALVRDERDCMVMGKPLIANALDVLADDGRRVPITVTASLCLNLSGIVAETGSLARWRADGVLQYLGESGAVAYVEGRRVDLDRLVEGVQALPGVAAAAAIVRDDPVLNRCIVIGIEPAAGVANADAHWEASVAALLEGVSSFRVHVGPLSRRADGSADPAALLVRRRGAASDEQSITPTQRILMEVWQEVLRVKDVGLHDNFFELGGTSLGAMQVSQQLEQRLAGRRVSPRRFVFETLGQLAAAFDELEPAMVAQPAVTVIEKSPVAANSGGVLSRLRRTVAGS
ncbi:hypothetical protein FSC37_13075 [Piscinibacter aquaticus]|uniref:Carrier domain-containing protein n=1 Tax=Piscinibacter aquaticus TaxID=392597 RepID=A0A5C6U1J8_9BURK|nr:hypothetical protein FSC37_13075 [Piscinibacter aquaticus]